MIKLSNGFGNKISYQPGKIYLIGRLFLITGIIFGFVFWSSIGDHPFVTEVKAAALSSEASGTCFEQVNNGAFGLTDGPYNSEESYEVIVFNEQLYVGMEADSSLGARIWRTKPGILSPTSQDDWEEVAADENGYPFGVLNITQNDHIDSLVEFNSYLYASTANGGSNYLGTRVFRSLTGDPGSWEDAVQNVGPGFNNIFNMNFKDMQVFDGWLCGGTQNWVVGAQVWCTADGTTWLQKNYSGFGDTGYNDLTSEVWSGAVFNGALYFGVQNTGGDRGDRGTDIGKLYRVTDLDGTPNWTNVFTGASGSYRVDILGGLNGYLYIAVRSDAGIVVLRSQTGDPGTWTQVNLPGMNGDSGNASVIVDSSITHNDGLILGVSNSNSGVQMWKTTGTLQGSDLLVDWERVGEPGLGDEKNVMTQLISFNAEVYAWTTNYVTGQQVRKQSECSQPIATEPPVESPTDTPTPETTEQAPTETPAVEPTDDLTPDKSPTQDPAEPVSPTETPEPTEAPTTTPIPEIEPSPTVDIPPACATGSESCEEQSINNLAFDVYFPLVMRP